MKTWTAKAGEVEKKWVVIDAEGVVLGRLAGIIALRLRGKHRPQFTPHMDTGDNVIVINAAKVKLTGNKAKQSLFYWHTGHPGGIKNRSAEELLRGKYPERVIENAVRRMIPEGPMGNQIYSNLRVYPGADHPHTAQTPEVVDVGAMNPKNKRGK